jgi:MoaA/NifB/PqqE/SkfB family radical SAM enzyme
MLKFADIRAYMPNGVKHLLKPYFRTLLPNQLVALVWITFRCNYRCSYCNIVTNFDFGTVSGRQAERSVEDWLRAMDAMPPTMFFFAGGEPMLYSGFPDLLNGMPLKHTLLGVVSNGTAKMAVYKQIKNRIGLNISFHREFIEEDKFVAKVEQLKELFNVSVNIVATRENLSVLRTLDQSFKNKEITLHVDRLLDDTVIYTPEEVAFLDSFLTVERRRQKDQLNYKDYEPKVCGAGNNYINIMPDGEVYTCAGGMEYFNSPLVKKILDQQPEEPFDLGQFKMGNIFDPGFELNTKPIVCPLPCRAACDRDFTTFKRVKMPAKSGLDRASLFGPKGV